MQTVLITGANRGIGLALTQAYVARGERVLATCRAPERAEALQRLAATHGERVGVITLDVGDLASIRGAVEQARLHTGAIDVLINNAALNPPTHDQDLERIDFATMIDVLRVNSAAPLMMTQQFLPLLRKADGAKVINISSDMGSIGQTRSGGDYAYSTSKAALNMVSRLLSFDLARYGITVVALDPGWVRTDMGGEYAALAPDESAAGVMRVIDGLTARDSGGFLAYDGGAHGW
jgi:NAD(P)-dependent dehydrogenase (short-subunit alcohol dehydrogenase family)